MTSGVAVRLPVCVADTLRDTCTVPLERPVCVALTLSLTRPLALRETLEESRSDGLNVRVTLRVNALELRLKLALALSVALADTLLRDAVTVPVGVHVPRTPSATSSDG